MGQNTDHDDKGEEKPPEASEEPSSEPSAIDYDRLIWDPEYRAEIARLQRERRRSATD